MKIRKNIYNKSKKNYIEQWQLLDKTLIQFFKNHYTHKSIDEVSAKVLLVGRGFATGIERQVLSDNYQGSSLDKTICFLKRKSNLIDPQIKRLSNLKEPLDPTKLETIIKVHGFLCKLLRSITRDKRYATSFSAKYLHFHAPIVPIYDSISYANAWRFRDNIGLDLFKNVKKCDDNYRWYIRCYFQIYQALQSFDKDCDVRLAENYLMWL